MQCWQKLQEHRAVYLANWKMDAAAELSVAQVAEVKRAWEWYDAWAELDDAQKADAKKRASI